MFWYVWIVTLDVALILMWLHSSTMVPKLCLAKQCIKCSVRDTWGEVIRLAFPRFCSLGIRGIPPNNYTSLFSDVAKQEGLLRTWKNLNIFSPAAGQKPHFLAFHNKLEQHFFCRTKQGSLLRRGYCEESL